MGKNGAIFKERSHQAMRYFCDVAPSTLSHSSISEHSATRILGLCALPLLQQPSAWGEAISLHGEVYRPLGAKRLAGSDDFKEFTFYISSDFSWDDGSAITAEDYARGINQLFLSRTNRFRNLLSDVEGFTDARLGGMSVHSDRLVFKLRNANRLFPLFFTFPALSPLHAHNPDYAPGPYKIVSVSNQQGRMKELKLAARWPTKAHQVEHIEFDFLHQLDQQDDIFGVARWQQGLFDCTWDTFFPYELRRSDWGGNLHCSDPNIFVLLSQIDCVASPSFDALRMLSGFIEREHIIAACDGAPRAAFGFSPESINGLSSKLAAHKISGPIIIGYEDFYPNKIIVNSIVDQLRQNQINCDAIVLDYGDRSRKTTLRLELFNNPFEDPILLFRNELSKKYFYENHPVLWRQFLQLFSRYQISEWHTRKIIAGQLDELLQQRGNFTPLLKLPGFQLRQPRVKDCSFTSGKLWEWS